MTKPVLYKKESEDLETHISICHERYLVLDGRLMKLEADVSDLKQDIVSGNKSLTTTIITTSGGIIVALIALVATLIAK
jgi:hypothetical protein